MWLLIGIVASIFVSIASSPWWLPKLRRYWGEPEAEAFPGRSYRGVDNLPPCPDQARTQALALGHLCGPDYAVATAHLDRCRSCGLEFSRIINRANCFHGETA